MGQAKRRGAFEQRLAAALERDKLKIEARKEARACQQPARTNVAVVGHTPRHNLGMMMLAAQVAALSLCGMPPHANVKVSDPANKTL